MTTKCCGRCKNVKKLSEFHKNSQKGDNAHNYCKKCRSHMMQLYHKRHRARRRQYYTKNRKSILLKARMYYEKKKDKQFNKLCVVQARPRAVGFKSN